jgi:nucleoside-triphosphatase THEP1
MKDKIKNKNELFEKEKEKIFLTKDDKENFAFSEKRHKQNEENFKMIISLIKLPFTIYSLSHKALYKLMNKEKLAKQEKEIERLKRVIISKERAREVMELNGIIKWDNKYLKSDGIFTIGKNADTGELIIINFNINANLLVGGMPGTGKTKLIQLIAFQCLKYGCKVYIGDFKGGVDTIRFANKCNVVTIHQELLQVLKQFRKEIDRRTRLFIEVGAENLKEYNEVTNKNLKREYLVIDELGEAMEVFEVDGFSENEVKELKKDIENNLKSIARLGRAFGLNLICGTQRPDVGIIEGQTRDQFGGRVCFKAIDKTSNIVLSSKIASELEELPGRAIVQKGINYIKTQVFLWDKETLSEIKNKKLEKKDLKIVNSENQNREISKDIIDTEIEL